MKIFKDLWGKILSFKKWFKTRSLLVKILILVFIVALGWFIFQKIRRNRTPIPEYQTTTVEKATLVVYVSASGQVSTANNAPVTTEISGVVKKIYVNNGDQIKTGKPIAEIELDQTSQQKYNSALASYQGAKNSLESAKTNFYTLQSKLFAANQKFINDAVARNLAISDPTYIQENADWLAAEKSYKNQAGAINQAEISLRSSWLSLQQSSPIIYAPISGTVTGLSLQIGSVISPQSSGGATSTSLKIANIETDTEPTITINLTEIDIPKIKVNDKATVSLDAYADKTYTGKVISVDTVGSISSGVTSYEVVIKLDTKVPGIYPNMNASASIITDTKDNILLIPSSAIQSSNGESWVRVMKNGQINQVTVETGLASDSEVEIISGLAEGDSVVTSIVSAPASSSNSGQSPFSSFGGRGFGGNSTFRMAR